jgi:uncharacterized protein (DUF1501 family)
MKRTLSITRRKALGALGAAGGALALGDVVLLPGTAAADPDELLQQPLLVFVYFGGGWDTLLGLDPRDHTVFGDGDPGSAIHTALDRIVEPATSALLAQHPTGMIRPPGSNVDFGLACGRLVDHFADLCIVRGVDMGTLTHEVGRRYFVTGKFPRGVLASGSSLSSWVATHRPELAPIPSLVLGGMESYNEGLDPRASGLAVSGYGDLGYVLRPLDPGAQPPPGMEAAIAASQAEDRCLHRQLDAAGIVAAHRAGSDKARVVGGGALWPLFDFVPNPPSESAVARLYQAFAIDPQFPAADLAGPKGRAAVAAQALTSDLCQAVSLRMVPNIDHHFSDWAYFHPLELRAGFDALADLITYLQQTEDPNGVPYWLRTTLVCFSEFARTPRLNAQDGRDHHLCNACLVAGHGIRGNQVIGASGPTTYEVEPFDFDAQEPAPGSASSPIRPADVHATVCEAMGLSHDHISNQEPRLLTAMLASS